MELREPSHVARALQRWRGLLVLDDCDAGRGALQEILLKLISTQELRVLCTAQLPLGLPNERVFDVSAPFMLNAILGAVCVLFVVGAAYNERMMRREFVSGLLLEQERRAAARVLAEAAARRVEPQQPPYVHTVRRRLARRAALGRYALPRS